MALGEGSSLEGLSQTRRKSVASNAARMRSGSGSWVPGRRPTPGLPSAAVASCGRRCRDPARGWRRRRTALSPGRGRAGAERIWGRRCSPSRLQQDPRSCAGNRAGNATARVGRGSAAPATAGHEEVLVAAAGRALQAGNLESDRLNPHTFSCRLPLSPASLRCTWATLFRSFTKTIRIRLHAALTIRMSDSTSSSARSGSTSSPIFVVHVLEEFPWLKRLMIQLHLELQCLVQQSQRDLPHRAEFGGTRARCA